jgi:short chain dehydrogenase
MLSHLAGVSRPVNRLLTTSMSLCRAASRLQANGYFASWRSFQCNVTTKRPAAINIPPSTPGLIVDRKSPHVAVTKDYNNKAQTISPLAPIGVQAALLHAQDSSANPALSPRPKIFDEFSLDGRVGVVSGANRGLGLEMALALCEAGCKAVYCVDLPELPSAEWEATSGFVKGLGNGSRLEYVSADVRDQQNLWDKVEQMADKEGRMDICIAAAGVLKADHDCLNYSAEEFREVSGG